MQIFKTTLIQSSASGIPDSAIGISYIFGSRQQAEEYSAKTGSGIISENIPDPLFRELVQNNARRIMHKINVRKQTTEEKEKAKKMMDAYLARKEEEDAE